MEWCVRLCQKLKIEKASPWSPPFIMVISLTCLSRFILSYSTSSTVIKLVVLVLKFVLRSSAITYFCARHAEL